MDGSSINNSLGTSATQYRNVVRLGNTETNPPALDMLVWHPDASARDAVHVLLVGNVERGEEANFVASKTVTVGRNKRCAVPAK